jgi:hypothetical protein
MIKHVGRIGDRKVAVVFREVPGEEHMALVLYTETLPAAWHDAVMRVIEDQPAQTAESLSDVLFRSLLSDGRPMLEVFHQEGMIKKVQTSQVLMMPSAGHAGVRLDELNKIINELKVGGEAATKLAELDSQSGLANKPPMRDATGRKVEPTTAPIQAPVNTGLDDTALAADFINQANRMETEAKGLLAESARLRKEASALSGVASETASTAPKRGRPRKEAAVADATN